MGLFTESGLNTTSIGDDLAEEILINYSSGVATVTLNRPDKRNAINYDGWLKLRRIAENLSVRDDVRVVVITGADDKAFSSGADIADFDLYRSNSEQAAVYAEAFEGAMDAIEAIPKPTICLIKGFCVGGGCEMTMAADLRFAADNLRFGIPTAHLGILIGYSEMSRLVELVGPGNASNILLTGRIFGADEALSMGLVNEVRPLDSIDEYVRELALSMVPLAPLSQSRHKRIMSTVIRNPELHELSDDELQLPFLNFDSEDFLEGRTAFLEKRVPEFKGR